MSMRINETYLFTIVMTSDGATAPAMLEEHVGRLLVSELKISGDRKKKK